MNRMAFALAVVAALTSCGDEHAATHREVDEPMEAETPPVVGETPEPAAPLGLPAPDGAGARALAYEPAEGEDPIRAALDAVRASPSTGRPWGTLGAMYLRRHREVAEPELLRLADDAIDAAVERDPDDTVALSMRGFLEMQAHRFAEAREVARGILRVDDDNTTALLLLGDAELELGTYDEAVSAYQRAADLRPDLRVYNRGAYVRWLHGEPQGALELLQLAIDAASPRDPEAAAWCWVDLALVHWHFGNRVQARYSVDQAMALVPAYLPARRVAVRLAWAEGHHEEAITSLVAVIESQETVGDLLLLAELLSMEGRAGESDQRLARAIAIRREDPRSLAMYRARHDVDVGDALDATTAELARRHDIYTLAAHGVALARAGRAAEALDHATRAGALGTPDASIALAESLVRHIASDDDGARVAFTRAASWNLDQDPWLAALLARELHVDAAALTAAGHPPLTPESTPVTGGTAPSPE